MWIFERKFNGIATILRNFCNKENSEIEEEEFGRIKSKLSISYKEFENRKAIKELKSKMQDKISKKEKEWENYYDELY